MITLEDLQAICPLSKPTELDRFVEPLNIAMSEFDIDFYVEREAAFLAQVAHESGGFHYVREIASGAAYEGRADLGNTEPGDGMLFKGRGLLQITGRGSYFACGRALGVDLIADPTALEQPNLAARSAGWFWFEHGLNAMADKGDFLHISTRINGRGKDGFPNGWKERQALWVKAKETLEA